MPARRSPAGRGSPKDLAEFDPGLDIGGVILNGVASERHLRTASEGLAVAGISLLGWVPRSSGFAFQNRHLGLVQARERKNLAAEIAALADRIAETVDLDRIEGMARPPLDIRNAVDEAAPAATRSLDPPGQRIALAEDDAFSFIYPHMTAHWREQGAEIVRFSPLGDEPPPDECDCCWLPGGYPELHAGKIAALAGFLRPGNFGPARRAAQCRLHGAGLSLEDGDGAVHAMAGLLPHRTSFKVRKLHLGYRRAVATQDCVLGKAGTAVRGHEFHYATIKGDAGDDAFLTVFDGEGRPLGAGGGRKGTVTGTFFHAIAREA